MPSAAYKLVRDPSRIDPNPVVITKGRAFTTSSQVADYFLCDECENRFSRLGEGYVFSQCARPNGDFKLRELLETSAPLGQDGPLRVYEVTTLLGSRAEQYLFFAASIFWRASARTWTSGGRSLERLSLGDVYQEQFRLYLLGKSGFPANARIVIHVWSEKQTDFTTMLPCTFRLERARRHKFCIPGILFILFLGSDVPKRHDGLALNSTQGQFMWLCPWQNDSLFRGFIDSIARSIPAGSLRRRSEKAAN